MRSDDYNTMTEQPNLVAGDEEGTPLEGTDHLVNGRVPGQGSGLLTETEDGAVTPIDGKPFSTEELHNNLTVGPSGKYDTLGDAYADIDDASETNRYKLWILEDTDEAGEVEAKSHIDVTSLGGAIIVDSDVEEQAVRADGIEDTTWRNVTILRRGAAPSNSNVLFVDGDVDDSVEFINCTFDNQTATSSRCVGVELQGDAAPLFKSPTAIGGDGGGNCYGFRITERAAPVIHSPYARGGLFDGNATDCSGFEIIRSASPTINDPTAVGGLVERSDGINSGDSASPTINGGVAIAGRGSAGTGLKIQRSSAPKINGLNTRPRQTSDRYNYQNSGDESFAPFNDHPFFVYSLLIRIDNAGSAGSTVDFGTSQGANDIATDVPIDGDGSVPVEITQQPLAAGEEIWVSNVDDTSADFRVYYTVRDNNTINGLRFQSNGHATLSNCTFEASYASRGVQFNDAAVLNDNWTISNSDIVTPNPDEQAIRGVNETGVVPIKNCNIKGGNLSGSIYPEGRIVSHTLMLDTSDQFGTAFGTISKYQTRIQEDWQNAVRARIVGRATGDESGTKEIGARQIEDNTDVSSVTWSGTGDETLVGDWSRIDYNTESDNPWMPRISASSDTESITVYRLELQLLVQ